MIQSEFKPPLSGGFRAFPKLARLNREMVVTEKLDGTNACVFVSETGQVTAQSRNRLITPTADNYGFAAWVQANESSLQELGHGYHYGEWWGPGIQRGYGLAERKFSLFNTARWGESRPGCCDVVPILCTGPFSTERVNGLVALLATTGSAASPGFMRPEGVVVYHTASNQMFKVTCEHDEKPKGLVTP